VLAIREAPTEFFAGNSAHITDTKTAIDFRAKEWR
jgi:hypothetical protein